MITNSAGQARKNHPAADAVPVPPVRGEAAIWGSLGNVWSQLFGNFRDEGLSFEWHDFTTTREFDWGSSFHRDSLELCLNLAGEGIITDKQRGVVIPEQSAAFYRQTNEALHATRAARQRHQFVTIEFSYGFIQQHLGAFKETLHPLVKGIVGGNGRAGVSDPSRLTTRQQHLLQSLREPPILAAAQPLWYRTKALELAAEFFFINPDGGEMFCQRQHRLASERVDKVIALLRRDLVNPPPLEDIGRAVGCSPFHLSRTFSSVTGKTIPQYIRELRMERAAELLKTGKYNVTEVAFEVGYSSLSHFSTAFHEMYGCCPGLYPLNTQSRVARKT